MSSKIEARQNGLTVIASSYRINLYAYRQIGGRVRIPHTDRTRSRLGTRVQMVSFFFGKDDSPHRLIMPVGSHQIASSTNDRWTVTRHVYAFVGKPIWAPVWPTGVVTVARVSIGRDDQSYITGLGDLPENWQRDADQWARSVGI